MGPRGRRYLTGGAAHEKHVRCWASAALAQGQVLLAGLAAVPLIAGAAATVEASAPPVGQTASVDRTSTPQAVIVVLRDQHGRTPAPGSARAARAAAVRADQAPLLDAMRAAGATHIKPYSLVNAFAATVPAASVAQAAGEPGRRVGAARPHHRGAARTAAVAARRGLRRRAVRHHAERGRTAGQRHLPGRPGASRCIEPEALQTIHAFTSDGSPNAQELATGAG